MHWGTEKRQPFPTAQGKCPNGCGETLFLGEDGFVTCSYVSCPDPLTANKMLFFSTWVIAELENSCEALTFSAEYFECVDQAKAIRDRTDVSTSSLTTMVRKSQGNILNLLKKLKDEKAPAS